MEEFFKEKIVLITGGTGNIGREFVRFLADQAEPEQIRVLSRTRSSQERFRHEFNDQIEKRLIDLRTGNLTNRKDLQAVVRDVDIAIHLAALPKVEGCEERPTEAVEVNIIGTLNLIEALERVDCQRAVAISTVKACNPEHVYGMTKNLMERIVCDRPGSGKTNFSVVRIGNVIGEGQSGVINAWHEKAANGGTLEIFDDNATLYFLPISQTIQLINYALTTSDPGEIITRPMHAIKLTDLAEVMTVHYPPERKGRGEDNAYKCGKGRPGWRSYDELVAETEVAYAEERQADEEIFYCINPNRKSTHPLGTEFIAGINSKTDDPLAKEHIEEILIESGVGPPHPKNVK